MLPVQAATSYRLILTKSNADIAFATNSGVMVCKNDRIAVSSGDVLRMVRNM
jgi:hypothetical protein